MGATDSHPAPEASAQQPAETTAPAAPAAPESDEPSAPAPLLELRDGLPPVVDTEEALADVIAGSPPAPARSRSTPSARRATATPRGPTSCSCAARAPAPRWSTRSPSTTSPTSTRRSGHAEWILHAATPGPVLPGRGGAAADDAVRHRAGRPAARLSPGRAGHPGRDRGRPQPAQGALRRRLVDAAAARAVAGVRRPRRRGADRAARGPRPRARGDRQGRVGPPGVRAPRDRRPARARASTPGAAPPACTRPVAGGPWPPCASCG